MRRLPAKRAKTAAPLPIPLALAVVEWPKALREVACGSEFVLPSGAETAGNVHKLTGVQGVYNTHGYFAEQKAALGTRTALLLEIERRAKGRAALARNAGT